MLMKILKKSAFFLVGAVIGGVIGAIISLGVTRYTTGGAVQPFEAEEFISNYFASAVIPTSAEQAWQALTPTFRQQSKGGYGDFLKWYANWRNVELEGRLVPVGNNQFTANVTYIGRGNQPDLHGQGAFSLSCTDYTGGFNPFNSTCPVKDIRMNWYAFSSTPNW
jgi:hypothetical protein